MQSRKFHLDSNKNLGDLDIENVRFGIKSHLEITSIIKLPHICNFKNKIPTSWEVKIQDKRGEGRQELEIFSFFVFNLFASHIANHFLLGQTSQVQKLLSSTAPSLQRASLFTFSEYTLQILESLNKTVSIH